MVSFVMERWDEFCRMDMIEVEIKARDNLLTAVQKYKDVGTIRDALDAHKGLILLDTGNAYIIGSTNPQTSGVSPKRLDELSDKVKSSLGILKLLEPKQYAPGIGMRIDGTTYYVADVDEQQP